MEIGIDSFAAFAPDRMGIEGHSASDRMAILLEEIEAADHHGIDVFGLGEHHREEYLDSSPAVILAAAAARTRRIRLTSAVTVLGAADPVRTFQQFATLDLISRGRAEMVVGRGSSTEAFPLFGRSLEDYDALFGENLDLLLRLRDQTHVTWQGRFRPSLSGQGVFPRPHQPKLPVWLGVGGTPASFVRAGTLGLPLMLAIIGGRFENFRPLVDLYREAGRRAGHAADALKVGVHVLGFVADATELARDIFFPGWEYFFAKAGRDRGWSPPNRAQFEAACSPSGVYLVGDPATVVGKIHFMDRTLGGVSRISLQMTTAMFDTAAMLRSIELLGREVGPLIRSSAV